MKSEENIDHTDLAEQYVLSIIRDEHPEWIERDGTCKRCEQYYKALDTLVDIEE